MTQQEFIQYVDVSQKVMDRIKEVAHLVNKIDRVRFPKTEWVTNFKVDERTQTIFIHSESNFDGYYTSVMTVPYQYMWMSNDEIVEDIKKGVKK